MEDCDIIELYWCRSEEAIAATAEKYGNYCRSIAFRILASQEDSEECVNDTYLKAWNAIPPHRPGNLAAFLGKITRNLAIDRYDRLTAVKRGAGQVPLVLDELRTCLPGEGTTDRLVDELALAQVLDGFLAQQTQVVRKIFMLRYWHVLSVREIAQRMNIGESKVKMTLLRARNALRKHLEQEGIGL